MNGMQMSSNAPKQQAVELRTGLEELFGQDVFVGIRVARSRLRGDPDFTQAAVDALGELPLVAENSSNATVSTSTGPAYQATTPSTHRKLVSPRATMYCTVR